MNTVRVVGGARKSELLRAAGISNAENWIVAFRCAQTFRLALMSPFADAAANNLKNAVDTLKFKVRSGDWIEMTCGREKQGCWLQSSRYGLFQHQARH